jgi:streptogramin lyase
MIVLLAASSLLVSATAPGNPGIYTFDDDFDQGTLVNVNHSPNSGQLQLDSEATPFEFIWVAASGRGTIVKIDTVTGAILGEYWSSPDGMGRDPSRTTVDGNGNVWAGNRAEASGGLGSVVHIGLEENGQCVDRNGNNAIDTSTGLGDIKPWPNTGGADTNGGVTTAEDECILHYVRTAGTNVRTVAVDGSNHVWVGGLTNRVHELLDPNGAVVPGAQFNLGCGGYGGLVDAYGVLWSASANDYLLRYDPAIPGGSCIHLGQFSYGLGADSGGNVWNTQWTYNNVVKLSAAGAVLWNKPSGGYGSRGVVLTSDENAWIANSNNNTVTRLDNDGNVLATIGVGWTPTGVAVDRAGKVWVTNYSSSDVMRIDPGANAVDLEVDLGDGATPYNYSDMTGSTLIAPPNTGTWTIVHDSAIAGAVWGQVAWTADTPGDSSIVVQAASSIDSITFGPYEAVVNGGDLTVADGQYLKVQVTFTRASTGESPILYDLTILANQPPDCSAAYPSVTTIWPPNHQFVPIDVLGVSDPDGDVVTITVTGIRQDEPVDTYGDGRFVPDGQGVGTTTAAVRAERSGTNKVPGNGRAYHIYFSGVDPYGYSCEGQTVVGVPHNVGRPVVDDGPLYDSTALAP